jgi:DNA-binding CsgD family transcriptional regulator
MTVRQQIIEMMQAGARNCEIIRKLDCNVDYVSRIRIETGIRKITATDRRIATIKAMAAAGKSDAEIAAVLYVSVDTVRHDRQRYGIKQRQIHPKHHEIIALKRAGFKQVYIMLELNVSAETIRKALKRQDCINKNTGTKAASAGSCTQQVDMMTTTDLQSDRPSDSVSSI